MTKIERVEMQLRREIEAALEEGWGLGTGDMFPDDHSGIATCCAIGARYRKRVMFHEAYCGLITPSTPETNDDMTAVAAGFDGRRNWGWPFDYYELGKKLRADYYETTAEVVK